MILLVFRRQNSAPKRIGWTVGDRGIGFDQTIPAVFTLYHKYVLFVKKQVSFTVCIGNSPLLELSVCYVTWPFVFLNWVFMEIQCLKRILVFNFLIFNFIRIHRFIIESIHSLKKVLEKNNSHLSSFPPKIFKF